MREININWTLPSGSAVTVLNFSETIPASAQRAGIDALLGDLSSLLSNQVTATVATEGREFDPTTGLATSFWAEPTPLVTPGQVTQQPVADSTQVLFRWRTEAVRAGRRVQGRTFIPGLITTQITSGNLASSAVSAWSTIAQAFVDAGLGFQVWSRPNAGGPGEGANVTTGTVWNELAVLRRRRG